MAQKVTPNVANVARAFWHAAGSGSFFTRWTVVISFVVSTVLFVPIIGTSTSAYGTGFVVAVITWVMLALPVTGVAVAERRMSNRGARAIVVIATLLAIVLSRPFLNDAVLDRLFGETGEGSFVTRMVTNVSVGFVLFGLVAMIVGARRRTRARTERLTVALDRWQAAMNAVDPIEGDGARLIASAAERLHAERDALLAGDIDFEAVRAFSESVRNASHVMEQASTAAPSSRYLQIVAENSSCVSPHPAAFPSPSSVQDRSQVAPSCFKMAPMSCSNRCCPPISPCTPGTIIYGARRPTRYNRVVATRATHRLTRGNSRSPEVSPHSRCGRRHPPVFGRG